MKPKKTREYLAPYRTKIKIKPILKHNRICKRCLEVETRNRYCDECEKYIWRKA